MGVDAVVLQLLDAVVRRDFDAATDCYTEDAVYHVRSWQEAVVGRTAIRAEFDRQAELFDAMRYEVVNLVVSGTTVFIERVDTITMFGKDVVVHWVGVHEIGTDGLITVTRDYYDAKEMESQLA